MYIKKTKRKYKEKTYTNYLLVQAIHTPKGPRQKTICSLGDLRARPPQEWLKLAHKVEDALLGQSHLFDTTDEEVRAIVRRVKAKEKKEKKREEKVRKDNHPPDKDDLVSVHVDKVRTEKNREAGPVHVGVQFWRKLDMERILAAVGLGVRAGKLTCAMVMNRLIKPKSEHAMPDWIRTTALDDILDEDFSLLTDDSLYRNLDLLHPNRGKIETALSEREKNLFNLDQTIYLYDVTSTYFEGQALANPKAKRGYSRDKRPDCPQVVVGLVVNRDGFPLAHEVFEGNRKDQKTLDDMLTVLDKRVGLKAGQTIVVDRGMAYDENLEEIRSRNLKYIVAARQPERDQWLADFEDEEDFQEVLRPVSPLNPFQKKTPIQVKMTKEKEETSVLCLSEGRKEKDQAIRENQEKRLLTDLKKLQKRIETGKLKQVAKIGEAIGRLKERYPRVARYYHMEYNVKEKKLEVGCNHEKMEKAKRLDGSYILKTDRDDLNAEEVWRIYTLLTRAEKAFRDMKSPLSERPIFHHLERRVETHIFLCVLAYHLLVCIEKTLLDQGVHTSWATVRETLSTHQIATVVLPTSNGSELLIRQASVPESHHRALYDLLKIPHRIIPPKKSWKSTAGDNSDEKI